MTHPQEARDVIEHLSARVPEYMLPQRVETVESLPRTAAGKLDRRALLAWAGPKAPSSSVPKPTEVATDNPAEAVLAQIWGEILGLSEVGIHENFFELGGDSLLSIRILARANQQGLHISPEQFFASPTVAEQAKLAAAEPTHLSTSIASTGQSSLPTHSAVVFRTHFGRSPSLESVVSVSAYPRRIVVDTGASRTIFVGPP